MLSHRQFNQRNLAPMPRLMALSFCLILLTQTGCINSLVMFGKVLLGDPVQPSGFETATGISLQKEEKRVLLHCSAPAYLSDEYDTLTSDIEVELISRLRRRGIGVMPPDAAADVLDDFAGHFDPKLLAQKLDDVDYIFHIQFDNFNYRERNSPSLYRGQASGRIVAYEIRGDETDRHSVQVYDQQFNTTHPTTHPVAADQMPRSVFISRFIDRLADDLGHTFYGVQNSELFVQ